MTTFGLVYVRLKAKRRRAVRAFRHALVRSGMTQEDRLAEDYEAYGRLRTYLPRGMRFRPLPFKR